MWGIEGAAWSAVWRAGCTATITEECAWGGVCKMSLPLYLLFAVNSCQHRNPMGTIMSVPKVLVQKNMNTYLDIIEHPLHAGWRNFFPLSLKGSSSPFMLCVCIARIRLVIHTIYIRYFLRIFWLNPNFLLAHRNRYSEEMEDGQKIHVDTMILFPKWRIYVFWYSRRTDGQKH